MSPAVLRLAHDLARHAVECAEALDDAALRVELGADQRAKLRGLCCSMASVAELLAGRRPLPTLLEVAPTTPERLTDQLGRAGGALAAVYEPPVLPWPHPDVPALRLAAPPAEPGGDQGSPDELAIPWGCR